MDTKHMTHDESVFKTCNSHCKSMSALKFDSDKLHTCCFMFHTQILEAKEEADEKKHTQTIACRRYALRDDPTKAAHFDWNSCFICNAFFEKR